ncbi:MAG TPA: alpha-(1-_3)-arabinofuranosyltransferase family protein [Acidimicrobiales bacterium]
MSDPEPSPPAPIGTPPGRWVSVYRQLRSPSRLRTTVDYLALALLSFIPMLASRPGVVSDDTKTYLYLDPGRYVRQATSLWDPSVALGTVTHENIGYLLPMGPFYWVLAELHVQLWVAQRLWMGVLLLAAGAGTLYLCRVIGLTGPGRYVASIGFMFTPYVLQYAGRISAILMPWAGLPWLVAFVILALRRGGWRYPARFALVVALVSGINASSIIYVGIAPVLWLLYSVLIAREASWRQVWGVAWRVGLLSGLVSLWWAIGLQVEAAYGVNVLKYTETVPVTSSTSLASEVIRGLGYWYFYGSDRVGSWTQASVAYTQNLWLVGLSFAVPVLAVAAAVLVKWWRRSYFILLVMVGMVLSVGAYPFTHPSGVGALLKAVMVDTTAGLAMRSTDRASPLVILGLAILLGAGVTAAVHRVRRTGLLIGASALAAIAGASAPLWTGSIIAHGFTQPAKPPNYVQAAATALNKTHPGTRVYALPGNDFAAYRWGDTIDTVFPGLLTRPFVTHEQQIMGSLPTADLLQAIDSPLQGGTEDWNALAPMASLMSAGDVLVQYDQAYERYNTPNPQQLALGLAVTPPGLSSPVSYGAPVPNVSPIATLDEAGLARPPNQPWTSPLVSYTVNNPRPVVRAESLTDPLVVDGNATGLVNAASVGLLSGNPTIFYAGSLDTQPDLQHTILGKPAHLVVTDTNRKQSFEWTSLTANTGYTQTASEGPDTTNPSDAPLNLFPNAPAGAQTTTVFSGASSVTASSYGSSFTYLPEVRPAAAVDGNTQTAWLDDSFAPPLGQWWQIALTQPTTSSTVTLVQPQTGDPNRWITKVTLSFDGRQPVTAELGPGSRSPAGQTLSFPSRRYSTLRITVDAIGQAPVLSATQATSSVGFAEVQIPGVTVHETVSLPQDLLRSTGPSSIFDSLTLLMTRLRASGVPPRSDTETTLSRTFWLPTARTFTVGGSARISPLAPDDEIDRLVGRPGADHTGIVAYSMGRLPGDLSAGAIATLDGNPATVWEPGFGVAHQAGEWLQYNLPAPASFDHLDLQVVADGQHSVPTSITVAADSGTVTLKLPTIADSRIPGSVVRVPLSLPQPLTGQSIRITFDTVRIETTVNYNSQSPLAMPIAIAEVGIPGLVAAPVPAVIPTTCRNDLLAVDGAPVWVSVAGPSSAALAGNALSVSLCGPDAGGLRLGPGNHTLTSAPGQVAGFDIDQLALTSAPGGGIPPAVAPAPPPAPPAVTVASQTSTALQLKVTGVSAGVAPFELVMGQSLNAGWVATINGHSLGSPALIDGFANGWRIDPATLGTVPPGGVVTVQLRWAPQGRVNIGLLVSLLAILVCLVLAFLPRARRRLGRPADTFLHDDDAPRLASLFAAGARRLPVRSSVIVGVATGAVAGVITTPVTGLIVGVATLVALLVPRLRMLLGLAAVGCVLAGGIYVVARQGSAHIVDSGSWPSEFGLASTLTWAGVAFLGADGTVEVVRRWRSPSPGGATDPPA